MIDSVFRTSKNYYPQVFLEDCKCIVKEKKIPKYIIDDVEISSDSNRENSDEGNFSEENCDEENFCEENSDEKNSEAGFKKFFICCHPTNPILEVPTQNILLDL